MIDFTFNFKVFNRFKQFHVTANSIGVIRGGKFHAKSDFGVKLKYSVETRICGRSDIQSFVWKSEVRIIIIKYEIVAIDTV